MVRYHASDMILALHSDGSCLSKYDYKSRAAGHFYLTNKDKRDLNNGAILTLTNIIKHVMGSAGETDVASLYYNFKNKSSQANLGGDGTPSATYTCSHRYFNNRRID